MWILRTPLSSVSRQASTLGIMPVSIAPLRDQLAGLAGGQRVDQRVGVVLVAAHAVDVAQEDQLLGAQRLGDGRGRRVGVDVQLLARLGSRHIEGITGTMPGVAQVVDRRCGRRASRGRRSPGRSAGRRRPRSVKPLAEQHVGGAKVRAARPGRRTLRSAWRCARWSRRPARARRCRSVASSV